MVREPFLLTGFYVNNVNFLFFDNLLSIYLVSLIFTSLAISGVSNSINIIDGFHGLASGTLIIMFFTFAVIGWYIEDHLVVHLAIISIFVFRTIEKKWTQFKWTQFNF